VVSVLSAFKGLGLSPDFLLCYLSRLLALLHMLQILWMLTIIIVLPALYLLVFFPLSTYFRNNIISCYLLILAIEDHALVKEIARNRAPLFPSEEKGMGVTEYPTIEFSVHKFIHHQSF
jgi:hypothetical protein